MIGDSIVAGLLRYKNIWDNFFSGTVNLGIGGDMTQNVLWRIRNMRLSHDIKFVVVHCGTNNIDFNRPDDIANALVLIADKIRLYNPEIKVILSGILPRDGIASLRREKIIKTNDLLNEYCLNHKNIYYLDRVDWTHDDGSLKSKLYYSDQFHLIEGWE